MLTLLVISAVLGQAPGQTACRSVHLAYPAPRGVAFYNEVTVDRSAPGSYFMVCGWGDGYFGIQELSSGKKVVIFSVWEPSKTNRPQDVAEDARVRLVEQGDGVNIGRFGGEGTGGRSLFEFDWQPGTTYRCFVTAKIDGPRTEYAGYFYLPETRKWKHLVTFSTPNGGRPLGDYYSFIEDFVRNGKTARQVHEARFGNSWIRKADGAWEPLLKARFTADGNPAMNIDAGLRDDRFFLMTGGDTQNRNTPLDKTIERPLVRAAEVPGDLPESPFKAFQK